MAKATLNNFVERFGDANQVAIPTGALSGITVVDVDGDAEDIDYALDTFGYPRVMVETPSHGVHLYYRQNGERNRTRIFGRPIDIRGAGGLVIVPGSIRHMEPYRFLEGGWDDLDDLTVAYPALQEVEHRNQVHNCQPDGRVPEGSRDNALFDKGRNDFLKFMPTITNRMSVDEIEAQMQRGYEAFANHLARWDAKQCIPPLGEAYVRGKAAYMWGRGMYGTLFPDGRQIIGMPVDQSFDLLTRERPRVFAVLARLRSRFPIGTPFICPASRAHDDFGMDAKTLRQCLRILEELGYVACLHRGGRYSPTVAKANPRLPNHGDVASYVLLPMLPRKAS